MINAVRIDEIEATLAANIDGFHVWDLYDSRFARSPTFKVGQLVLVREVESDLWTAANAYLRDVMRRDPERCGKITHPAGLTNVRGRGIMRRLILELLPHYKKICSDKSGTWSDDAVKMWTALNSKKLKTKECPKGFVYLLLDQAVDQ